MSAPDHPETLKRLKTLAHLLDNALPIPGTSYRVGIDPLLGLIPALGDYSGLILSGYLIWESGKLGVSQATLWRMAINVAIDSLLGIFPIFGDLFDVTWKANEQNVKLLTASLAQKQTQAQADQRFLIFLLGGLVLLTLLTTTVTFYLLQWGVNLLIALLN